MAQPYPGLRPFDVKDAFLFFGREQPTSELLDRLSHNRFLAVVGTSGSGKSSLVRAGLLPALYRGYMAGATTRWKIAVMRPGAGPLDELASALTDPATLGGSRADCRATLSASTLGLVSVVKAANLEPGESLLLVVDQFEEIFRFAADSRSTDAPGEALLFVTSLLEAVDQFEIPVYVALTMRTDYLGDCSAFPGLPEALNRSQYLVPRLSREQRKEAIEKPIELFGAEIAPRLVQQILNDMGNDPDQLPVMQHALARMYRLWKAAGGDAPLDLDDYHRAGTLESALNDHAETVYAGFTPASQEWTRKLFRCLTKTERGRQIRRAGRLDRIFRILGAETDASQTEVMEVVEVFTRDENSCLFLTPAERRGEQIVDITHESLIRKWRRFGGWVKEEAASAEQFSDLLRDTARQAAGERGYWVEPELSRALSRKRRDGWTPAWAEQYSPPGSPTFPEVEQFLKTSQARERRRNLYRLAAGAGVVVLLGVLWYAMDQRHHAQSLENELVRMDAQQKDEKLKSLQTQLHSTTDVGERKVLQAQVEVVTTNILTSLEEENRTLKTKLVEAANQAAAPAKSVVNATPLPPAPAEDTHAPEIAGLRRQITDMTTRVSDYEALKKKQDDSEKELATLRKRLNQSASDLSTTQQSVAPPTSAQANPQVVSHTTAVPDKVANPIVPLAPSSAREQLTIENDSAIRLQKQGITLLMKHIKRDPLSADLYVLAGTGSPVIKPFFGNETIGTTHVNWIKQTMPSCKGAASPANIGGYRVWCLHVDHFEIDASKGKRQYLGILTTGTENLIFYADDFDRKACKVTISILTEK
jgi:energy-coupling factor transporter ATP-binding protein EcfA2